nr:hypothetical protein Iba_chr08cCG14930 [Ipomoea batatas]
MAAKPVLIRVAPPRYGGTKGLLKYGEIIGKNREGQPPFQQKPNSLLPLSLAISELPRKLHVTDGIKREATATMAAKKGIILGHPAKIRDSYIEAQLRVPDRGKREAIAAMAAKPKIERAVEIWRNHWQEQRRSTTLSTKTQLSVASFPSISELPRKICEFEGAKEEPTPPWLQKPGDLPGCQAKIRVDQLSAQISSPESRNIQISSQPGKENINVT